MEPFLNFIDQYWRTAIEILILWFLFYQTFTYFRATRGAQIFVPLIAIFITMTLISRALDLGVMTRLLNYVAAFFAIALVVIFQPELRRALAELGSHRWFSSFTQDARQEFAERLVEIVETLSKKRVGALIAIQRSIDLRQYLETGVEIEARLSSELVTTIFYSGTTLHDGGMIIRLSDERILGAGCVFPLNQREMSDRSIGLRHRASMGITEESDAITIVVSEETGRISLGLEGNLEMDLSEEELLERLQELLVAKDEDTDDELGTDEETINREDDQDDEESAS